MQVLTFEHDDRRFQSLLEKAESRVLIGLTGPVKGKWKPPQFEVDTTSKKRPRGEFLYFNANPLLMTQKAKDSLASLIGTDVEFLPVPFEKETLYIANVTRVVDCLDHSRTQWKGEKEFLFQNPVFDPKKLGNYPIFKTPENSFITYVRESFVEHCKGERLRGLAFKEQWRG